MFHAVKNSLYSKQLKMSLSLLYLDLGLLFFWLHPWHSYAVHWMTVRQCTIVLLYKWSRVFCVFRKTACYKRSYD